MKLKLLSLMLAVGVSVPLLAQDIGGNILLGSSNITVMSKDDVDRTIIGSPYLNPEYMESTVEGFDDPLSIRYNAYTDEMEFEHNGEVYALTKEEYPVVYLGIQKIKYEYLTYQSGRGNTKGFLRVLVDGVPNKVYKKESIGYTPFRKASSGYDKDSPPEYKRENDKYFIKVGDNPIVELPTNRKRFSKLFGDKEGAIEDYLKKNKMNLDSESNLINIVKYANTL